MVKKKRNSDAALLDVFGTTGASKNAILKWKASWRETGSRVAVTSFSSAAKILRENNIDTLYYQFAALSVDGPADMIDHYVVFYNDEHKFFFKLHYGVT
jgi:hypothetical protein